MPEIRFEAKAETVAVLDGYCSATGRCRTSFINSLLDEWAAAKLHEARVVVRVADSNPTAPESRRKGA
jgi:cob(I)alamin adenosyltransferase